MINFLKRFALSARPLAWLAVLIPLMTTGMASHSELAQPWSEPRNLSNSETSSADPTIVADQYGSVHVFWSEDLEGEPHEYDTAPRAGNAILYSRLDLDGEWSEPVDVVYVGPNGRAENPNALIDDDGVMHLTWIEAASLAYSFANVTEAGDPRAWSAPIILTGPRVADSRILDLDEGVLVVFTVASGPLPGVHSVQVVEGVSKDLKLVWLAGEENGQGAQFLSAARDANGGTHIVWEVNTPPNPTVEEVRYAKSVDDGQSWSRSRLVARTTSDEDRVRFARPWVAVRDDDEIHLEWAQGRLPYRWHQISFDGGDTWQLPYQIWPDLVSNTNSQAVGVDSSGTLRWVDVLRYPNGAYSMSWQEGAWTTPELFYLMQLSSSDSLEDRINAHRFRMAISLGNQMHVVFQDQDRADIYHMMSDLDVAGIPAEPIAVNIRAETVDPEIVATSEPSDVPTSPSATPRVLSITPGLREEHGPSLPILVGVGSSLLIIGLALLGSRLAEGR